MKGQYLALEYVIFFAMGITIIIGVYFLFSNIEKSVSGDIQMQQLEKVGIYLRSQIGKAYIAGNKTNSSLYLHTEIPRSIVGCIYSIITSEDTLTLRCDRTGNEIKLSLYGIRMKNKLLFSSSNKIKIHYSKGLIELVQ